MNKPNTNINNISSIHTKEIIDAISGHIYVSEASDNGAYHKNLHISPQVEELTGYPIENFQDWKFWPKHVIHPEDQAQAAAYAQLHQVGQSYQTEYRIIKKDGSVRWVRDSAKIRKSSNNQNYYIYGLVSDITHQKETEIKLYQQTENLEKIIHLRTQKLNNLVKSQRKFITDVNHEIRNPLAYIKALAENYLLIGDKSNINIPKSQLSQLNEKVDQISAILKNLMVISELDSQNISLTDEVVNLKKFFDTLTKQISQTYSDPATFNIPTNSISLHVKKRILEEICSNIILNAIQHAPSSPQITITTAQTENHTNIIIQDNNPQIPTENAEKIFQRGYSNNFKTAGSGLGLYLCKHLVQYINGEIYLKNNTKLGNTFIIEIKN